MKIPIEGAEFFYADGQTDIAKLIVAFPNFAKATKKLPLTVRQYNKKQMDKDSSLCGVFLGQSIMYFKKSKYHEFIQRTRG
jgi:hypothetical protein